jgi:hypothetical protein
MILNLSRSFHFERGLKGYNVAYVFTKGAGTAGAPNEICLELNVSVNDEQKEIHKVNKPAATLYQANEVIEKMIEEETVSFFL